MDEVSHVTQEFRLVGKAVHGEPAVLNRLVEPV
jgi:hypothetical protein